MLFEALAAFLLLLAELHLAGDVAAGESACGVFFLAGNGARRDDAAEGFSLNLKCEQFTRQNLVQFFDDFFGFLLGAAAGNDAGKGSDVHQRQGHPGARRRRRGCR